MYDIFHYNFLSQKGYSVQKRYKIPPKIGSFVPNPANASSTTNAEGVVDYSPNFNFNFPNFKRIIPN